MKFTLFPKNTFAKNTPLPSLFSFPYFVFKSVRSLPIFMMFLISFDNFCPNILYPPVPVLTSDGHALKNSFFIDLLLFVIIFCT